MARLIVVIEVQTTRGHGASRGDPVRTITQYWSVEEPGTLLAESVDPYARPDVEFCGYDPPLKQESET